MIFGFENVDATVHFANEVFDHFFGGVEVCDHAVTHGADRFDGLPGVRPSISLASSPTARNCFLTPSLTW